MKNRMYRCGRCAVLLGLLYLSGCTLVAQEKTSLSHVSAPKSSGQQAQLSGVWRLHSKTVRRATARGESVTLPTHPDLEVFGAEGSWYTRPDHADSTAIRLVSGDWSISQQTLSIMVSDGDVVQYTIDNLTTDSLTRTWTGPMDDASATVMEKLVRIQP